MAAGVRKGGPRRAATSLRRRLTPDWVYIAARRPLRALGEWRAPSDRASRRRIRELRRGAADGVVPVGARALGGRAVYLRPRSSDLEVFWDTFVGRYHLPPPDLRPLLIWDLGANIGLTMAHFAVLYPEARIVGVELDEENAALGGRNLAPWGDRCELIHAAVSTCDGTVAYDRARGNEWAFSVTLEGNATAPAISPETLLERAGGPVDYAKVDIEGSERELLEEAGGWAEQVRAIKVEVHEPWTVAECATRLRGLGFVTSVDRRHWASVLGRR